jgi:hypothetical protein
MRQYKLFKLPFNKNVFHIQKKGDIFGDKNDASNYRPVALLTSFSKIFEKVIFNRIYHHINNNHILVNEQFGFRHASSTDIASYKLTKNILTALINKLLVGGIFSTFIRHLTVLIMTFFNGPFNCVTLYNIVGYINS